MIGVIISGCVISAEQAYTILKYTHRDISRHNWRLLVLVLWIVWICSLRKFWVGCATGLSGGYYGRDLDVLNPFQEK